MYVLIASLVFIGDFLTWVSWYMLLEIPLFVCQFLSEKPQIWNWVLHLQLQFCYFISMCFILIFVHLQLWLLCLQCWMYCTRYQCCLDLTWEGLGIMLMTLSGWFWPCLGVGCYNVDGLSIYDILLQHQHCQQLGELQLHTFSFLGVVCCDYLKLYMLLMHVNSIVKFSCCSVCRLGSGFPLKEFPPSYKAEFSYC